MEAVTLCKEVDLRDQQSEEGGVAIAQVQPLEVLGQDLGHSLRIPTYIPCTYQAHTSAHSMHIPCAFQ